MTADNFNQVSDAELALSIMRKMAEKAEWWKVSSNEFAVELNTDLDPVRLTPDEVAFLGSLR